MGRSVTSRYEILEKIGEGGYGTVYKARDLRVPRFVALKFVFPQLLGSDWATHRFRQEAKAICSLSHPNIVVLHDFDTDPETGQLFLVMEYLGGGTLRELIQQNNRQGLPFHAFELCRCAAAMAAGLGHAHRHAIIHRDVKSSNVMFSEERLVKITDFGLAKADAGTSLTDSGHTPGTACYMSPEQARGLELDHRTDVFSLGVVLYEMATGQLPFTASSSYEVLHKIVTQPTPSLQQSRADMPEELDRIIQRATAKQAAHRYQSMEELEQELAAVQDRLKRLSEQPTAITSTLRKPSRVPRRAVLVLAALAFGALLVLGAVRFWLRRAPAETAAPPSRMLAVIPFQCLGRDESRQAFCEGLANTLSMKLTQMEAFQNRVLVIPYSEVRHEKITSAAEASRVFKANLALTGSVEFLAETVRIIINLVDADRKIQTASNKLDSTAGGLAALQDQTSALAAGMLKLGLTPAETRQVASGQTANEAAYDAYVRGLGYLARSDDAESARHAAELLERAVRLDPSYALAHAHLAEAYLAEYRNTDDPQWIDRAGESCRRALQIDDRLAQSHVTLAKVDLARTDPQKAIAELNTALRLEPRNADALRTLGNAYIEVGIRQRDAARQQQALQTFQQAIALRPELWTTYRDLGSAYRRLGDLKQAEEQFRRMLAFTESAEAYNALGGLYHLMGRMDDAVAMFQKSLAIKPTPEAYSNLGTVYYYLGRYAEMIPNYENALRLSEKDRTNNHIIWGNLAIAYMRTPGMEAKGRSAFREAIRIAEAKLQASPNHAATHASLAYYLVRMGDNAGALRHADQAVRLAPDGAQVLFRCALVYERLNRRDQALQTLERAIEKGHPMKEVLNAGDLAALRNDPRFQQYLSVHR